MTFRWQQVILILLVLVAFLPRALPPRETINDEANHWIRRSYNFMNGIRYGKLYVTSQTYHPGVTTMWLTSMGMILVDLTTDEDPADLADYEFYFDHLTTIHLPLAVVNAAVVLVAYWFMRRLWGGRIALVAAFFWALDPYLIGYQRVLHIDGLMTSFMTLSFLSGLIAFRFDGPPAEGGGAPRWRWLAASAMFGALATLSKYTGIYALPVLFLFVIMRHYIQHKTIRFPRVLRKALLIWILVAGGVVLLLFPATWAAPLFVIGNFKNAFVVAYREHIIFFNGDVGPSANFGPQLYFAVILLRMTPWVMVGLMLAAVGVYRRELKRHNLLWLVLYIVLYWAATSLQTKKLGRYMLPLFPIMAIVASIGIVWLWDRLKISKLRYSTPIVGTAGAVLLMLHTAWYHPYPLSFFNPVLGGGSTAENIIMIGQGEGLGDAFDYIHARGCEGGVMIGLLSVGRAHTDCPIYSPVISLLDEADYLIMYVSKRQTRDHDHVLDHLGNPQPDYISNINGVEFAHVYDLKQYTVPQGLETATSR